MGFTLSVHRDRPLPSAEEIELERATQFRDSYTVSVASLLLSIFALTTLASVGR